MEIDIINDLIRINNDRAKGYQKAISELKNEDQDLKSLFNSMAEQSHRYRLQLEDLVNDIGGEAAEGTTGAGKLYRSWMDVKAILGAVAI